MVVLCYYGSSVRDMQRIDSSLPVCTADAHMRKESDFVFFVTLKTDVTLSTTTTIFLMEKVLMTVALTRTRKRMIIIGSRLMAHLIQELRRRVSRVILGEFFAFCE